MDGAGLVLDLWGNPVIADAMLRGMETERLSRDQVIKLTERRGALAKKLMIEIVEKYQDGDEIFWYCSPRADWEKLMGSEGYVLIRGGYLVSSVLCPMN